MPPPNIFPIAQHFGAINCIRYVEDAPIVELVNACRDATATVKDMSAPH
jgi:hypothetical protein